MTFPVYKIEIYNSTPTLIHTIEKEAVDVYFKETLTSNVGTFRFSVPAKIGTSYKFDDVAANDKVKIWLGYKSVSGDPDFVGKIQRSTGSLTVEAGYRRIFRGISQGEVLKRRFKTKRWQAVAANTIVTELANDLGLGTGEIGAEATTVTLHFEDATYLDVLKAISDYWVNAGTQLKKDFYVDVDNNLVWKDRPLRSSGVETFTIGDNIIGYQVLRDLPGVFNYITVFGERDRTEPTDADSWTESLTGWTATQGSLSLQSDDIVEGEIPGKKAGSYSINCTASAETSTVNFYRTITEIDLWSPNRKYLYLRFWDYYGAWSDVTTSRVRLVDVDGDYFQYEIPDIGDRAIATAWQHWDLGLGPTYEYDVEDNPDGLWTLNGTPNWQRINKIQFVVDWSVNEKAMLVDGLHFAEGRFRNTSEDATSQTNYEKREYVYVDNNLKSDSECQKRSEALLYQLKDLVIRLDLAVVGNPNLLIGDRLPITIPAENLSSVDFDVVSAEQSFNNIRGYTSACVALNTANMRSPPARTTSELWQTKWKLQKDLGRGIQIIK